MSETLSNPGGGPRFIDLRGPDLAANTGAGSPENNRNYRSFNQIKADLEEVVKNPDPQREKELRIERARLLNDARSAGADEGILDKIKNTLIDIQRTNNSLKEAIPLIEEINSDNLEVEAGGIHGWDPRFEGLIDEYKQGALRNMTLEYLKKTGAPQVEIDKLQREIDVLNWGLPPAIFKRMPVEPEVITPIVNPTINVDIDPKQLAREMAREQGIQSPVAYMHEAIEGEEFLKTAQRIVPGQEPRFWIILDAKERNEWIVRSTLWIIAAKKSQAFASEELMMDKMHDLAVDMNKWAHQILWGEVSENGEIRQEGKAGVLPATSIYTNIISDIRFRDWMGQHDQKDSKKVVHKGLYEQNGKPSDFNLKRVFFDDFDSIKADIATDYGALGLMKLNSQRKSLSEACPDSIYPHDKSWGTSIDAEGFKALRSSVRFWLTTSGRDLLLNADELANRNEFFENKERALDILEFRAREAEIIAWNYVYALGTLETFDSRAYRPEGTKRHGPSSFWTLALWTAMHLQERFEQKVLRKNDFDEPEGKEEWAGALGTWALRNYEKGSWDSRDANGIRTVKIPQILPDVIFRGGLFNKYIFETGRDSKGIPATDKDDSAMYGPLNKIGREVLANPRSESRFDIAAEIKWNNVSDTPYVSYVWDEIRWGNVLETGFKKGMEKVKLTDLSEAVRNLRFDRKTRMNLLKIFFGINPNSPKLTYAHGLVGWLGVLSGVNASSPNYFLEK